MFCVNLLWLNSVGSPRPQNNHEMNVFQILYVFFKKVYALRTKLISVMDEQMIIKPNKLDQNNLKIF